MIQLKRRHDWPERLAEAVTAARAKTFAWGTFDCGIFLADSVLAMTGQDPAGFFRGRYSTRLGAWSALLKFPDPARAAGLIPPRADDPVAATVCKFLGDPLPGVLLAQRGDVAVIDAVDHLGSLQPCFAVVAGRDVLLPALNQVGLASFPLSAARLAWRL